jgi:hypothetical protein
MSLILEKKEISTFRNHIKTILENKNNNPEQPQQDYLKELVFLIQHSTEIKSLISKQIFKELIKSTQINKSFDVSQPMITLPGLSKSPFEIETNNEEQGENNLFTYCVKYHPLPKDYFKILFKYTNFLKPIDNSTYFMICMEHNADLTEKEWKLLFSYSNPDQKDDLGRNQLMVAIEHNPSIPETIWEKLIEKTDLSQREVTNETPLTMALNHSPNMPQKVWDCLINSDLCYGIGILGYSPLNTIINNAENLALSEEQINTIYEKTLKNIPNINYHMLAQHLAENMILKKYNILSIEQTIKIFKNTHKYGSIKTKEKNFILNYLKEYEQIKENYNLITQQVTNHSKNKPHKL